MGTYAYLDKFYAETGWFHWNFKEFNVYTVEENYITQIVKLERNSNDVFNITNDTSFSIAKGEVVTRKEKSFLWFTRTVTYQKLTVTERTETYEDNKPTGRITSKTYEVEEKLE